MAYAFFFSDTISWEGSDQETVQIENTKQCVHQPLRCLPQTRRSPRVVVIRMAKC